MQRGESEIAKRQNLSFFFFAAGIRLTVRDSSPDEQFFNLKTFIFSKRFKASSNVSFNPACSIVGWPTQQKSGIKIIIF